ncbi:hypothetical protein [Rummeliibacillus sp. BSL5]
MQQQIFTDKNGEQLIVQYRKSAIFFLKKYREEDLREHRNGGLYIDGKGLYHRFEFAEENFKALYDFLIIVARKSWISFNPRVADSMGADYDDYYDKEFDNNGLLQIGSNVIKAGGPYAQPPNKYNLTRLIKFNRRKFESFIYDFKKELNCN